MPDRYCYIPCKPSLRQSERPGRCRTLEFSLARTETVLTVFVASPGDVTEERNRLEDAISEWNRTWARDQGLRLELLRWETDVFPDIGLDAQDVINRQIPDDYDLFVGIMWSRFGTPTLRAGSGTVEEFERALTRRSGASDEPGIFFYFKDAPVPPSKIDTDQLKAVQEFKERLATNGVLRWEFVGPDQFEKLVALHITRFVQSTRHRRTPVAANTSDATPTVVTPSPASSPASSTRDISSDDVGYLDQLEEFEEQIGEVNAIADRLTQAQQSLTQHTTQGTAELQALAATPSGGGVAQARRLISGVAAKMLEFTAKVTAEVPLFRAAMSASMAALTRAATLSVEFNSVQTKHAKAAAVSLLAALTGAKGSMAEFRKSTLALPRITKELNVAKRQQTAALDSLIAEFEGAEQLLVEAIAFVDALPSQSADAQ